MAYEKAVAQTGLDPRRHELVRYQVAQLNQCALCLVVRREGSGVTEAELAQVGTDHEDFTPPNGSPSATPSAFAPTVLRSRTA